MEKKDSEMESGIESDPEDDPSSQNDATRAAAAAVLALHVCEHRPTSSSIDKLIESLMVPPPPPSASPPVDADTLNELTQLVRTSPSSTPPGRSHRSPSVPSQSPDDIYSNLVIPPPPASHVNNADVEAFLAKIVACNGIVGPETLSAMAVNALSVTSRRCFGRQLSEQAHFGPRQLAVIQSTHNTADGATVSDAAAALPPYSVDSGEVPVHHRCASVMNRVEGESRNHQKGYLTQTSISAWSVCEDSPAIRTSHNDERLNPYHCTTGVMNGAEGIRHNIGHSDSTLSQSGSVSEVPSAAQVAVSNYGCALRTPGVQNLQEYRRRCDGMPPVSSTTVLPPMLPWKDDVGNGRMLTRSMGRRRPPPPPPPRTSSVQNSPALSCRSEQLTFRGLPRAASGEDRLTPLPTPPPLARSALIRPGALRSSFTGTKELTTATCSPPSPDWNFRRSHSLTESAITCNNKPSGKKTSLLAAIGSRLRSYWSPSPQRNLRDRPATSTGDRQPPMSTNYRRLQFQVPFHYGVGTRPGEVLTDDGETYFSFSIPLTSGQLQTSPTTSSFSSFTGE